jgi:hypothetical protein
MKINSSANQLSKNIQPGAELGSPNRGRGAGPESSRSCQP